MLNSRVFTGTASPSVKATSRKRAAAYVEHYSARAKRMIDHTGIGVANVALSAAFYDAALGALGMRRSMQMPEGVGTDGIGYGFDYPIFWIDRFHPALHPAAHGLRCPKPV